MRAFEPDLNFITDHHAPSTFRARAARLLLLASKTLISVTFFCAKREAKKLIPKFSESSKISAQSWRKLGRSVLITGMSQARWAIKWAQ